MKPIITASLCLFLTTVSTSGSAEKMNLEPCINGKVSSTGLFATQALEDKAIALTEEPYIHGSHNQPDWSLSKKLKNYFEFARLANGR
ncbi:MAG: hypothetical protein GY941_07745 [Planctomycetes bacterium]|nr:hypothetical protein [Planctomycetota bacterium]